MVASPARTVGSVASVDASREDFNATQRAKLLELACQAADYLDTLSDHALGDAVLVVEVAQPDGSTVLGLSTTDRYVVRRGIVEQYRDYLASTESDAD